MPEGTDDFFECMQIGSDIKIRVTSRYPGMYDFFASLVTEDNEILEELRQRNYISVGMAIDALYRNVNWNKLKPGVSKEMLQNAAKWINDGYLREAVGKKDVDTIKRELSEHLYLLKRAYYKEEYL